MRTQASIGIGTLTFIVLFVLKILGAIDMNWFWVLTSWIWMPIVMLLVGTLFMFFIGILIISLTLLFEK